MRPLSPELMAAHRVKNLLRDPRNWYHPENGRVGVCLAQAITWAVPYNNAVPWPAMKLRLAFEKYTPNGLVRWNDAPGRTHGEVMELCEKVILDEERRWAMAA